MKKIASFIKRLLCDHGHRVVDNGLKYANGRTYYSYQNKCAKCGKVWRL